MRVRALSAKMISSSLLAVVCLGCATAYAAGTPPDAAGARTDAETHTPLGQVPQPTPENPGLVWGITLGELYTNNLGLAPSNAPRHSSFITEIRPFVKAAIQRPRFSGLLDASLTGYAYAGKSEHNQLAGDLRAEGTLSVLPQHLFITGSAIYGREVLDQALPSERGTFYLDHNQINVARAAVGPYWVQNLGRVGTLVVRYSRGRVIYNQHGISGADNNRAAGIPDVTSNAWQLRLASPKDELWGWHADYSEQRLDPDFGRGIDFASASVGVSRRLSPGLRVLADVGKQNKFLPDGTIEHLGAPFWDVGVEWANARDRVELRAGHRFYGPSYRLSWTHDAALLSTTLSYIERPTDLNQQLLGQGGDQIVTAPIGIPQFPSLRERRIYLMKRASASLHYQMPHSRLTLLLYNESRKYFLEGYGRESVANASLRWAFDLGASTQLTPRVGWQRYRFRDAQVNHNRFEELALVHRFNPGNFGTVRVRHDSRNVDAALPQAHGYGVTVVFVQWTHLL